MKWATVPSVGTDRMRELPDPFVLAVLLADSLLLLLFFDRFLTALRAGFACFKDLYRV